jgi:hypothetical protein
MLALRAFGCIWKNEFAKNSAQKHTILKEF